MLRNLPLSSPRCRGSDNARTPTICPQRNQCQRHKQVELDRQLELPADVVIDVKVMGLARVGLHNECHYFLDLRA